MLFILCAGAFPALVDSAEASATFVVQYDAAVPNAARPAVQAAVDTWASLLTSSVPITIRIQWAPTPNLVLTYGGWAGLTVRDFFGAPLAGTQYVVALGNALTGHNFLPNFQHLYVSVNSNVDWYLGTDGQPGNQYDLRTAVLREMADGLGLASSMMLTASAGSWGGVGTVGYPFAFDRFVVNGAGQSLVSAFANNSAALRAQLTGGNLFFNGPITRSFNGGAAAKLSAPATWEWEFPQTQYLDELTYPAGSPDALLTPILTRGEVIHHPGNIALSMLADLGWIVARRPRAAGDFDGDGKTDIGVFRPSTGNWYVRYAATGTGLTYLWGGQGDVPTPGDYDGDRRADIAIFRPSNGTWYVRYTATGALLSFLWGGAGDVPAQGDYDGDGKTDMAVFRPSTGTWYVRYTVSGAGLSLVWGGAGDVPTQGDYDGDGRTDIAIFRPSNGTWYVRYAATGTGITLVWGGAGDVTVPGDYDGDGRTDIAIFRVSTGTWFIRYSVSGAGISLVWGGGTDIPAPGDFDGDGLTDIAIFRPSTGTWFIRYSATGAGTSFIWGGTGDIPVLGRQ